MQMQAAVDAQMNSSRAARAPVLLLTGQPVCIS